MWWYLCDLGVFGYVFVRLLHGQTSFSVKLNNCSNRTPRNFVRPKLSTPKSTLFVNKRPQIETSFILSVLILKFQLYIMQKHQKKSLFLPLVVFLCCVNLSSKLSTPKSWQSDRLFWLWEPYNNCTVNFFCLPICRPVLTN